MSGLGASLYGLALTYLRNRYRILFYTVLLTLVSVPILSAFKFRGILIESFLAANLLAAIMPVNGVRRRPYLLLGLVAAWLLRLFTAWLAHPTLSAITLAVWTVIGLLAAAAALRFAMNASRVDSEHLHAALSAYLLAGIYFGLLYWVLEQTSPGTFSASSHFSQAGAIYFSFVTLATLGYGDIAPHGDIARGIAIIEGVGGQLFLAVLVARLVSLYSKPADT
jgi:Ion channel